MQIIDKHACEDAEQILTCMFMLCDLEYEGREGEKTGPLK